MEQETIRLNNLKKNCDEQIITIKRETERLQSEIQAKTLKLKALEEEREEAIVQLNREKANRDKAEFLQSQILEEIRAIQVENDQHSQRKVLQLILLEN